MYGSKYVLLYSTAEHCWWWQTDLISFDYIGLSIASVVDQLHKSPLWRIQDIKNWLLVLHNTKFKILQLWRGKGGHFEFELIRITASFRKASVLSVLLLQACLSQTVCTTPKNIFKVEGVENLVSHSTYSPSRISHKGLLMPQSGELRGHWRHLSLFRCKKKKHLWRLFGLWKSGACQHSFKVGAREPDFQLNVFTEVLSESGPFHAMFLFCYPASNVLYIRAGLLKVNQLVLLLG